jgi:Threonine aldolase
MYSFRNDYSEGAHPKLLEALAAVSREQNTAYGNDRHSLHAAELIRQQAGRTDADVHFFEGGTQTNLTAIAAFLRPHEAPVAATTGHINTHETGAVEATGHKVLTASAEDGKLTPALVRQILEQHPDEHMVKPKLVYISDSTEVGTIYSKAELTALSRFCRENDLYLYLDGARLGSALTSPENDLVLSDVAELTDAFYIGGTKNGALLGEALVICNPALKDGFRYILKQRGAMLAKGTVLGTQFEQLFQDHLYFELAAHANRLAGRLNEAISGAGFRFLAHSPTNQIFPVFPDDLIRKLQQNYDFELWKKVDDTSTAIRLVTSWATPDDEVETFIQEFLRMIQ